MFVGWLERVVKASGWRGVVSKVAIAQLVWAPPSVAML